ncbi:MAG: cobyric acid synthase [Acidimicrobiales bacterium]|nr:cobyric acid synthase [Acidimicrobiales bacterium]
MSASVLAGGLMVCGTTSDAGKSTLVAGLCRWLYRRGVRVAPFKAQNMSLNAAVTPSGGEIGRAQAFQAFAAGVAPEVTMNPVLLKPVGERTCQVVVNGRPWRVTSAAGYHELKDELFPEVVAAYRSLRSRFDVVICEGAGSPAEINLFDRDIVNLRLADAVGIAAVLVGDINPGGVFASLYGTVGLLPPEWSRLVRGFVINKLRGDPELLLDGCAKLEGLTGVPALGVLPWLETVWLDAEDSMSIDRPLPEPRPALADELDVAVIRLPRIANATDLDALRIEPGVRLRWVHDAAGFGRPDLVILPGSKSTVNDLAWLRTRKLDTALASTDATVLGICAGYQMLGHSIDDRVESASGLVKGLGFLPVDTVFGPEKVTRLRTGHADGARVSGYQIHHGRVRQTGGDPFVVFDDSDPAELDGVRAGRFVGTTLHGLFDADEFRRNFLGQVAASRGKRWYSDGPSLEALRTAAVDSLADVLEERLDLDAVEQLIAWSDAGAATAPGGMR